MKFVGLKINKKQEQDLDDLELHLRRINPKIKSRSAAIKEAIRITLHMIRNNPLYKQDGLTEQFKPGTEVPQSRFVTRIPGHEIDLDGRRKKKP